MSQEILGTFDLVVAAGFFHSHAAVALEATVIYLLWISITYFISLLKQEQAAS